MNAQAYFNELNETEEVTIVKTTPAKKTTTPKVNPAPYKTIRRDWIKKQIALGNIEAKCDYIYTDDYAFDNAYGFQKTDWMIARLAPERKWEEIILPNGNTTHRLINSEELTKEGFMSFEAHDFEYSTGRCYWDENCETISFIPLSGHSYTLRIKK